MTQIYVIATENATICKIGISDNPAARLKQLQTGNAEILKIHHTVELGSRRKAELIESLIHKNNSTHRMKGEWFNMSIDDAIAEVDFHLIRYGDDPLIEYKLKP